MRYFTYGRSYKYLSKYLILDMSNFFTTQPYDLDLSRLAYQDNNKDIPKKNFNIEDHINSELMINTQDSFERNNERINGLNNEITEYKKKLKEIPILQNEIVSLKMKIADLSSKNNSLNSEINKLINKINKLESENSSLKISSIDKTIDGEILIEETIDEEKSIDKIEDIAIDEEYITIDVKEIKSILYNKLTAYHEEHIEKLILNYGLVDNSKIEKSKLSELLLKAIHL